MVGKELERRRWGACLVSALGAACEGEGASLGAGGLGGGSSSRGWSWEGRGARMRCFSWGCRSVELERGGQERRAEAGNGRGLPPGGGCRSRGCHSSSCTLVGRLPVPWGRGWGFLAGQPRAGGCHGAPRAKQSGSDSELQLVFKRREKKKKQKLNPPPAAA